MLGHGGQKSHEHRTNLDPLRIQMFVTRGESRLTPSPGDATAGFDGLGACVDPGFAAFWSAELREGADCAGEPEGEGAAGGFDGEGAGLSETGADVGFGGEAEGLDGLGEPDGEETASAFLLGPVLTELGDSALGGASLEGIVGGSLQIRLGHILE